MFGPPEHLDRQRPTAEQASRTKRHVEILHVVGFRAPRVSGGIHKFGEARTLEVASNHLRKPPSQESYFCAGSIGLDLPTHAAVEGHQCRGIYHLEDCGGRVRFHVRVE